MLNSSENPIGKKFAIKVLNFVIINFYGKILYIRIRYNRKILQRFAKKFTWDSKKTSLYPCSYKTSFTVYFFFLSDEVYIIASHFLCLNRRVVFWTPHSTRKI